MPPYFQRQVRRIQGAADYGKPLRPFFLQPEPNTLSETDRSVGKGKQRPNVDILMVHACGAPHDGPGDMSIGAEVKHPVQEMKQVCGYGFQVLVPQAHQPHSQGQSKEALAAFKHGDPAQAKMFRDQAFVVIHGPERQMSILYGAPCLARAGDKASLESTCVISLDVAGSEKLQRL